MEADWELRRREEHMVDKTDRIVFYATIACLIFALGSGTGEYLARKELNAKLAKCEASK